MQRREWLIGALVFGVLTLVSYVWLVPPAREPAPAVALPLLNGESQALAELEGKPVLLAFWATTCTTCVAEMPSLTALYNELSPEGFELVGVAMAYDPEEQVRTLVAQRGLPYTIALDRDGLIAEAFNNVRVTPTTVLINPQGEVVWQRIGHLDFDRLEEKIRGMLAQERSA